MLNLAKNIHAEIQDGKSGGTFDLHGELKEFESGYLVATHGEILPMNSGLNVIHEALIQIFSRKYPVLFGYWIHENEIHLDAVKHVQNFTDATKFGKENNQIAIYSCEDGRCVKL